MTGKKKTTSRTKKKTEKKATKLEAQIWGYRLIVDRECGWEEEPILICCGQPKKKVAASSKMIPVSRNEASNTII